MFNPIIDTILHSMFPVGELRTAIPVAIHVLKLDWSNALFYSLFGNSLITLILVYLIDFLKIEKIKYFDFIYCFTPAAILIILATLFLVNF